MDEDTFQPEHKCSWCGGDLSDMMEVERISFDAALEVHVEECEPYIQERDCMD